MADIRTVNEVRARMFAGGAFFRAKNVGKEGNNISIVAFEYAPKRAKLIITNHNTKLAENVSGPASVSLLDQFLNWNEGMSIALTDPPTAEYYSISWQIRNGVAEAVKASEDLGIFDFSRLYTKPGKLSVKLSATVPQNASVSIVPRTSAVDLVWIEESILPDGWKRAGGYSISDLRAKMAGNTWVEMSARGYDVNDPGDDDSVFSLFPDTYLSGGNGMPLGPAGYNVDADPEDPQYIVLLNESESLDGSPFEKNQMFKWNSTSKTWELYVPEPEPV